MAKLLNVNPESCQVYPTNSCVGKYNFYYYIIDFYFTSVILEGTVPYMAPEVRTFQGYDSKADVFSIGALVYEMATGDVYVHNGVGFINQAMLVNVLFL